MNCVPGDVAVIYRTTNDACGLHGEVSRRCIGHFVRVTHLRPPADSGCSALSVWHLEEPLSVSLDGIAYTVTGIADEVLRPLRDQPGEDEVLRIAGYPNETPAEILAREVAA